MSACSDNQSTILPFPSSPHWAPTTTTLAISRYFLKPSQLRHDHFGKPAPAFPDRVRTPGRKTARIARMRASHRIKDATGRRKPDGCRPGSRDGSKPLISPENSVERNQRGNFDLTFTGGSGRPLQAAHLDVVGAEPQRVRQREQQPDGSAFVVRRAIAQGYGNREAGLQFAAEI